VRRAGSAGILPAPRATARVLVPQGLPFRRGEEPQDESWVLDFGEWASVYRTWLVRQAAYRDRAEPRRRPHGTIHPLSAAIPPTSSSDSLTTQHPFDANRCPGPRASRGKTPGSSPFSVSCSTLSTK